ncbi:MAG: ArsR/SmtB family transcription factor [Thermodesulfobacteriota bacterium]
MKELFKLQANVCKTMANPVRMAIIYALKEGEKTVSEMVESMGLTKSNISQHLAVLKRAEMVRARREGTHIFYSMANPKIIEACRLMREVLMEQLSEKQRLMDRFEEKNGAG